MTTTVKVIATQRVTVRPDVTESVTVVIKAVGPQGATGSSSGDMTKVVYDPTNVLGDAFAMDNMAEGTLTKIMTSAERTKLAGIQAGATVADTAAEVKIKYESNANTNALTDAEKVVLGNTSGTNTGDQSAGDFDHDSLLNVSGTPNQYNHVNDAEYLVLQNTSGTNTGDQDLSGKENVGVAAGLVTVHETNHPSPTNRDTRNAPALGVDDNYVTDAEKIVIGNTSGTNTGDQNAAGVTIADAGGLIVATDVEGALQENRTAIDLNTAKVTNANHTGEVTGDGALTIADNVVDEANLKLDEAPTNDYVLTADSTKSGGMKWAASAGGGVTESDVVALVIALG
jgi:hypothetical protein